MNTISCKGSVFFVVCFVLTTTIPVFSDSLQTVVIVQPQQDKLSIKLRAELSSQGFSVLMVETDSLLEYEQLRNLGFIYDATAVMQVSSLSNSVTLLADDTSALTVVQEISVSESREDAQTLLVLKSVEMMRAALLSTDSEKALLTYNAKNNIKDTDIVDSNIDHTNNKNVEPTFLRLSLNTAVSAGFNFRDIPVALCASVSLRLTLSKHFTLNITGIIPTIPITLSEPEGSVDIKTGLVSLGFDLLLLPQQTPVQVFTGIGAGPLFFRMRGAAAQTYISKDANILVALPNMSLGLSVRLNNLVSIRGDWLLGFAVQRPVVKMLDRNIAILARPLSFIALGIEVKLSKYKKSITTSTR